MSIASSDVNAMRLRGAIRKNTRGAVGYGVGYGLKIGYWPCQRAPFIQLAFHHWRFELWYGLPSYKEQPVQ
jgi:hypothetical protein